MTGPRNPSDVDYPDDKHNADQEKQETDAPAAAARPKVGIANFSSTELKYAQDEKIAASTSPPKKTTPVPAPAAPTAAAEPVIVRTPESESKYPEPAVPAVEPEPKIHPALGGPQPPKKKSEYDFQREKQTRLEHDLLQTKILEAEIKKEKDHDKKVTARKKKLEEIQKALKDLREKDIPEFNKLDARDRSQLDYLKLQEKHDDFVEKIKEIGTYINIKQSDSLTTIDKDLSALIKIEKEIAKLRKKFINALRVNKIVNRINTAFHQLNKEINRIVSPSGNLEDRRNSDPEDEKKEELQTLAMNHEEGLKKLGELHAQISKISTDIFALSEKEIEEEQGRLVNEHGKFKELAEEISARIKAISANQKQTHIRTAYEYKPLGADQTLDDWKNERKPGNIAVAGFDKITPKPTPIYSIPMPEFKEEEQKEIVFIHNQAREPSQSYGYQRYFGNKEEEHFEIALTALPSAISRHGILDQAISGEIKEEKAGIREQIYKKLPPNFNSVDLSRFLQDSKAIPKNSLENINKNFKEGVAAQKGKPEAYLKEAQNLLNNLIAAALAKGKKEVFFHQINDANLLKAIDSILYLEESNLKKKDIKVNIPTSVRLLYSRKSPSDPEYYDKSTGLLSKNTTKNYRLDVTQDKVKEAEEKFADVAKLSISERFSRWRHGPK